MDDIDRSILQIIQSDNRVSSSAIGLRIGLSVSAVNERVRRLNMTGTVRANRAQIDADTAGLGLCAFLLIDLEPHTDEEDAFINGAAALPEIQEIHHITGPHNYLIKVRVKDTRRLQTFLSEKLKRLPGLMRTESTIVLETHKETTELALTSGGEP